MSPPLRVLLFGYGLAGRTFHAPLVQAVHELQLASVVTADPARTAAAGREVPDVRVVPDVDAALALADEHDLAVVATASGTHVAIAEACLAAGLHVVVDKPVAPDAATVARLVEHAVAQGRQLHAFHNRRWDSDFLTLRGLLDAGRLGQVHRFESRFERWRPEPSHGWRDDADPAALGGLLYDLGTHLVDQALVAFGPVDSVYAEVRARRDPTASDDDVFVALHHAGGTVSHLWASALAASPGPRFRVLGRSGGWTVDGLDGQEDALRAGRRPGDAGWGVEPADRRSTWWPAGHPLPLERGRWDTFYPAVAGAVLRGEPGPVDPAGVVAVATVLDAARRSASTGEVVPLSDG